MRHHVLCAAVTIVSLILISCTASNKGTFFLVNKATEPIAHASVVICGQTIELKDISPSNGAGGSYKVTSDSHYTIQVEFKSGKRLKKETGYVTNGMDFQDEITVTDSDIEITDSKVK